MKAVIIRHYGGPEVLELADVPSPKPTAGQVLVRIEAAAVNPIDGKIRKGEMKMTLRLPFRSRSGASTPASSAKSAATSNASRSAIASLA
jgi:NADPH:quinone reductase-like Zn-dependent oxidoreductase